MRIILFSLILFANTALADSVSFQMSNPNMIQSLPSEGLVEIPPIDPTNLNAACNQIYSPNTCQIIGSNVRIGLAFNYVINYSFSEGGTVNAFFDVVNGSQGLGSFSNVQPPSNLMNIGSGATGVEVLTFEIPVNSGIRRFSMDLSVDLVLNP